jgi:hypothetical protein
MQFRQCPSCPSTSVHLATDWLHGGRMGILGRAVTRLAEAVDAAITVAEHAGRAGQFAANIWRYFYIGHYPASI